MMVFSVPDIFLKELFEVSGKHSLTSSLLSWIRLLGNLQTFSCFCWWNKYNVGVLFTNIIKYGKTTKKLLRRLLQEGVIFSQEFMKSDIYT